MPVNSAMVGKLLRQQAAIAAFGSFALRARNLSVVLGEAARVCAETLNVRYSKVCRYSEADNDLIVVEAHGWNAGVIGYRIHPNLSTPQGRAFKTGEPFIGNVLADAGDLVLPPYYAEHGVVSTMAVIIVDHEHPYGVLEIDSVALEDFDEDDINFLTSFANVLGEAVATAESIRVLAGTVEEMRLLVEEKDRLLEQKKILAAELQHRVRNNLQLIYGMLSKQIDDTPDDVSRRGLKAIARRVFTLAQVYDQLLGADMTRTIDFSDYLRSLCLNLVEVQGSSNDAIRLDYTGDETLLDLDVVTSLGIIVTELITNSFDHAFPTGEGVISIALYHEQEGNRAVMTIRDNGRGFVPMAGSKRHGVGLVYRLSEQIGGTATVEIQDGTLWTISVPL